MFVWRLNDSYLYLLSQTQIVFSKCKGKYSRATQIFYALRYLKSDLLKYTLKIQISTNKMKHPETILPCPNQLCMLNSSLLAFTCIKNMNVEIIKLPSDMGTESIIVNGFSFTKNYTYKSTDISWHCISRRTNWRAIIRTDADCTAVIGGSFFIATCLHHTIKIQFVASTGLISCLRS